jgi:Tol biopolymer transport system component
MFSHSGRRIVTASDDKTARIWDAATGRQVVSLTGHGDRVWFAAFSPDDSRVVTASYDKSVRIWDAVRGLQLAVLLGHTEPVATAAFSPDGRRIVTASDDKTARIWDAVTGRQLSVLSGHLDGLTSAAFSPDGERIVTSSYDKTARIWDAITGRQRVLLTGHTARVEFATFSPGGQQVVTAADDGTARIWDAAAGEQVVLLSGHSGLVSSAAFSPDSDRVVTASTDRTARIWDARSGRQLAVLRGHTDPVEGTAFSPDGRSVVTASDDGTARVWDARVSALDVQLRWAEAAQFDPLSPTERFQLGLPTPTDVRRWPADRSRCDEAAAAPYDPDRRASGSMPDWIVTDIAIAACAVANTATAPKSQALYQHGRALMASGKFAEAERDFVMALADGYRAAAIDLGMLLSQSSGKRLNLPKAISLYEHAWNAGVSIAAFELGYLYENGVPGAAADKGYLLAPDIERAWTWYRKGADVGEPSALARFAGREDAAAFGEQNPAKSAAHLLEAFKYYAAACERATIEDWPDEAWRTWRYRRASLARVLARKGTMEEVAASYENVLRDSAPTPPTLLQRLIEWL